jgi:hypothetical protein
VAHTTYEE